MDFFSWQCLAFFAVALELLLAKFNKYKKLTLLAVNYFFLITSSNNIGGVICIVWITILGYFSAFLLRKRKNKYLLAGIITAILLPLLFVKFSGFLSGINTKWSVLEIPLGVSFYSLSVLSYILEFYKGRTEPTDNFLSFAAYVSFFPSILSGPVNRPNLLHQIEDINNVSFDYDRAVRGLRYVLLGYFLKVLVAGRTSALVSVPFSHIQSTSGVALMIASVCYTIYIFSDFCGYSFIVFGLAKIMGIEISINFRAPYHACSLKEFWRRWHISLTSWLTDYIYIPLGGSRCSKARSYLNILITFLISGLWHGTGTGFLVWGLLNGMILIGERLTHFEKRKNGFLKWVLTIAVINCLWIFFRADTASDAVLIIYRIVRDFIPSCYTCLSVSGMLSLMSELGVTFSEFVFTVVAILSYLIYEMTAGKKNEAIEIFSGKSIAVRWAMYVAIIAVTLIFGATGKASEFIYAQF